MDDFPITRRTFFRHLTLAGATTLLPLVPTEAASGEPFSVGPVSRFQEGTFHAVTLPNRMPIFVRRLPGKNPIFLALSALCTHKGCRVAWNGTHHKFLCPCHGGQFDAAGRNVAGPPPRPLAALHTTVRNGILYVQAP